MIHSPLILLTVLLPQKGLVGTVQVTGTQLAIMCLNLALSLAVRRGRISLQVRRRLS